MKTSSSTACYGRLSQFSIRRIINGSFFSLILVMIISMGLSTMSLFQVSKRTQQMYDEPLSKTTLIYDIQKNISQMEHIFYKDMSSASPIDDLSETYSELKKQLENNLRALDALISDDERALANEITALAAEADSQLTILLSDISSQDFNTALSSFYNDYFPFFENAQGLLEQLLSSSSKEAEEFIENAHTFALASTLFHIGILAACVIFTFWIAKKVTNVIVTPILLIKEVMLQMSQGNLEVPLDYEGNNELGILAESVRSTTDTLDRYVTDTIQTLSKISHKDLDIAMEQEFVGHFKPIQDTITEIIRFLNQMVYLTKAASENVTEGADQVSGVSQALAQNAYEQNAAVLKLAASIRHITGNVEENAQYARHVNNITKDTLKKIEEGNQCMQDLLTAMAEITEQSKEIQSIIKVIDSIASQTNLLSLNASIEAARAGDAGKGFAVVAEEIGTLAKECTQSAKNTSNLIKNSIEVTAKGSVLAKETAGILTEIVLSSEKTGNLVENITNACGKQADGLEEISQGIESLSNRVESLSSMSEEAAASSQELLSQSESLTQMLREYQLKES